MAEETGIARSVLADQVKDRLLQDIMDGRYPPDARIVETRVARELGTSQAPVREALRALEAIGVVEILPFRGARVRRPTAEELLEAIAIRSELESFGAREAVARMTDEDLERLVGLADEMQRGADAGDRHRVAIADAAFHGYLIRLAGNATLERLWRSLEPFARTYITATVPGVDVHWTAGLHDSIVKALRARDPERVVAAMRRHFEDAGSKVGAGWRAAGRGEPTATEPMAARSRTA